MFAMGLVVGGCVDICVQLLMIGGDMSDEIADALMGRWSEHREKYSHSVQHPFLFPCVCIGVCAVLFSPSHGIWDRRVRKGENMPL